MNQNAACTKLSTESMGIFERYLTVWVFACIIIGIGLGKFFPQLAGFLDAMAISINDAPIV